MSRTVIRFRGRLRNRRGKKVKSNKKSTVERRRLRREKFKRLAKECVKTGVVEHELLKNSEFVKYYKAELKRLNKDKDEDNQITDTELPEAQ